MRAPPDQPARPAPLRGPGGKQSARVVRQTHQAAARKQHRQHQQQADTELPEGRRQLGEIVLQDHVDGAAEEGAVEPPGAAEDEHHHHLGGTVEVEHGQGHIGVGLREQRAGHAGDRRRERVDGDHAPVHRRTDRMHAPHVLADTGQRLPERRVDQPAHQIEHDRQHEQHVDIIGVAVEVVVEQAEHRLEGQARQAVIATGDVGAQVARLLQHGGKGDRQHQEGQAAVAQDEPADPGADKSGDDAADEDAADRFAPAEPQRGKRDRIGADAEERRVAQRDDPRIAKNKVERQREHDHDQHLAAEGHPVRIEEEQRDRDQPGQRLIPAEIMAAAEIVGGAGARVLAICRLDVTHGRRTPKA